MEVGKGFQQLVSKNLILLKKKQYMCFNLHGLLYKLASYIFCLIRTSFFSMQLIHLHLAKVLVQ